MSKATQLLDEVEFGEPLLEIDGLSKYFQSDTGFLAGFFGSENVKAVDDVTFDVKRGETLALVGESGCGKSTLARAVLQLLQPTDGSVQYRGKELTGMSSKDLRPLRQNLQMIFQDPQSSLNPRMKVGQIIEEPMKAHSLPADEDVPEGKSKKEARRERSKRLLEDVGLKREYYNRYPHEFSGGQRQRLNLARALSTNPDFVMCDEPVSALDVSVQAQVLNTMQNLQDEFGLTYLFISHDLSVVRYVADRVAVMYLGHIMELGDKEEVFENPQHPYTQALLDAIPVPDPRTSEARAPLEGDVPSPINPPSGCRFRTRCPKLIQPGTYGVEPTDEERLESRLREYGMDDETWQQTLQFTRAVDRRTFTVPDDASEREIRDRITTDYFSGTLPRGAPGETIEEAIDLIAGDEWQEAGQLLVDSFEEQSICAIEHPEYIVENEEVPGEHFVSCHLHRNG